jgi:AcrR family transcriptional regulator
MSNRDDRFSCLSIACVSPVRRAVVSTRDRILDGAQTLFNAEGYGQASAVDVANALGISPGHLYYHFKGKAEIAAVLLERCAQELSDVEAAARAAAAAPDFGLEALWTHVHILMEEAAAVAFFHREAGALARVHAGFAAWRRRTAIRLHDLCDDLLAAIPGDHPIAARRDLRDGAAAALARAILDLPTQLELEGDPGPPRATLARAAAQAMLPVAALLAT